MKVQYSASPVTCSTSREEGMNQHCSVLQVPVQLLYKWYQYFELVSKSSTVFTPLLLICYETH